MPSQYCSAGKVVANLRCTVQLHTRSTRQDWAPQPPAICSDASGTRTSRVGAGHGGSSAEQKQASMASSQTIISSTTAR
ncbi:hypothetical protein D9M68_774820 [compost metagenome]